MENMSPHGDVDGLGADVADYLAGQRVLTLATASGWGFPHAVAAGFSRLRERSPTWAVIKSSPPRTSARR